MRHQTEFAEPVDAGFFSFQFDTTSSHVRSGRIRVRVASFGFLEVNRYPRCLKLTMSPGWGSHLLANSFVPADAENRTPFGLLG